ncbi:MAG: vitamin B12-dependent ribonucleotide reductase [Candidatus Micrarchaeota archaeon]
MAGTQTISVDKQAFQAKRFFTKKGVHPFDTVMWESRNASINDSRGKAVFFQNDIEAPSFWSQSAINIMVSKYFRGNPGTPSREKSVKQVLTRVAKTIADWGRKGNYFSDEEEGEAFEQELTHMLLYQMVAFNSPVWFNVGVEAHPQCSACFINTVKDDMRSILQLAVTEGMLFKYGSGSGVNMSTLRSSREALSFSSGKASGPVSFMRALDTLAGVIKSGGKTRRAAKMVILNIDHPDVVDFINAKANEEKKAWVLIDAGYDGSVDGEAYKTVQFQNANHSVRVTDDFMNNVVEDSSWTTHAVTTGKPVDTYKARDLMKMIAECTYICGDPGMQFDTTVNRWNTCPNSGRINGSNPCSEFMFLDETSCNLASLNLMKFRTPEGEFDIDAFKQAVEITIAAQEIIVDSASYPLPQIAQNSSDYRPLGLGYANLGALLMSRGLPYDGDDGRNFAAAITSILTAHAYATSALLAKKLGAFKFYKLNEQSFLKVIEMHKAHAYEISADGVPDDLFKESRRAWDDALELGTANGFRNSQVSLLAPTGTIAFLMDCDTTGIEPDLALVKYKWLVGGGMMKIVNNTVPEALKRLGYSASQVEAILKYISENDTIEGAPHVKEKDLPVFDCAFKASKGKRSIHYLGHVRMMSAVQPLISGAISKTVNMPADVSTQEITDAYVTSWRLGLKAVAIYRDGSKRTQPLTTTMSEKKELKPNRRHLPDERRSITHKFSISGHEGYVTVGLFEDGTPGEIFITMAKQGSTISGLMDSLATTVSIGLQYGIPLRVFVTKFVNSRFEPSGVTNNEEIRFAKSIVDYIFKWLALKFLSKEELANLGIMSHNHTNGNGNENGLEVVKTELLPPQKLDRFIEEKSSSSDAQTDAPLCTVCGSMTIRSGSCYACTNCGNTTGCS